MRTLGIIIILILLQFQNLNAKEIKLGDKIIEGEIIYNSETCIIVESKNENGLPLFWVFAEVVNFLVPDAGKRICLTILGEENQEICENISNSFDFISSFASVGKRTVKFFRNLIESTVEKKAKKSSLYYATESLDLANNIKNTLEAYQKLKIVKWENYSHNEDVIDNDLYAGLVRFENKVNTPVELELSNDGVNWIKFNVYSGESKEYSFWKGNKTQSYGFCRSNKFCNYQIFTNKTYKIRYDNYEKNYKLEY